MSVTAVVGVQRADLGGGLAQQVMAAPPVACAEMPWPTALR
ncbi:hypothetical protein ACWGH8_20155 [Nonomuraea muscovyensis]|uniref:Uncharacterized protein n=1 Tax=Nonomuraea muscovyensis TaxID=1124761 RepID=A0A7X0F007_9ACTN|nr:hypothetical protein [Nonomuraea muscovyensis]MBB6348064.1 hypothetical protein [Nonomuraea muscovyensis]